MGSSKGGDSLELPVVEVVLQEDECQQNAGPATGRADVENGRLDGFLSRHHDLLVPWNPTA